ncbi:MAG: asparagine synthase (glutamine-hydrolyzing), partial [Chloroflexi bacterium]|nr:asparagine synthase (glutamine-hydrolyzing) [Chloroflexota bacterium]
MCGIAGLLQPGLGVAEVRERVARMSQAMQHRGPDDWGLAFGLPHEEGVRWEQNGHIACFPSPFSLGLGHQRLSIIDLSSAGRQPMANREGSVWITYNGEVYNFRTLRQELEARGHHFRSQTDTEVIITGYEEWGEGVVQRLNGIFAFGILDLRGGEPKLFVARDHFGVKPLYYVHRNGCFAFASEIKALLLLPEVERRVDLQALHQYLTFLWVPDPKTMLEGIAKLPAGHYATVQGGQVQVQQYWDVTFPPQGHQYPRSPDDLKEELRERFRRSVTQQMVSDVPLGAFLSSGMDSTAIVAMMSQATNLPVNTYTITFPRRYLRGEVAFDNAAIARKVAERFGCRHTEIIVEPDVVELLPKLVWHLDEPISDPAAITAYLLCREAKKSSTVLLSGVGGDELFSGYRKHLAHYLARYYQLLPSVLRRGLIEPLVLTLPSFRSTPLRGYMRLAKKMARSGSLPPRQRFLTDATYFSEDQKEGLYSGELRAATSGLDPWERHQAYFERVDQADFLNQMLYLDSKAFMVSLNLTYADKMSMASAVEVRVPFLDRELWEFAAREIPPHLKLHGFTTKYIFRQAMDGILPPQVL